MPKVSDNHIMDTKALKTVLSVCPLIELPEEGDLHHLVTVEGVKVLVWNFTQFTRCSSASINDFILVNTSERCFDFEDPCPTGHISLPFFTIESDLTAIFRNVTTQKFNESFVYPDVAENVRMDVLFNSLKSHQYDVRRCKSTKSISHYCQFLGGGDIYIQNKNIGALVFISAAEKTPDEGLSVGGGNKKGSPLAHATSKLCSLSIEGKKGISADKIKYQLWANMITRVIERFITSVDPPEGQSVNQLFTKDDLFKLKEFIGYGVACAGDGMVGVYKLEMKLGKPTLFITKLKLGSRERLLAAGLIDFTLHHFLSHLQQLHGLNGQALTDFTLTDFTFNIANPQVK